MHPVEALKLLFGPLARYTATSAKPLPDGTLPARGGPAEDWRDPDQLREAGRLNRVLLRVQAQHGGDLLVAVLEAFYSRAGVENQAARLDLAVEDLQKRGVRPRGRRGRQSTRQLYQDLLEQAVRAFAQELRRDP